MARSYLVFGDTEASSTCFALNAPSVSAIYLVRKLIAKHGRKGNMVDWREMLNADCPKRDAPGLHNREQSPAPELTGSIAPATRA